MHVCVCVSLCVFVCAVYMSFTILVCLEMFEHMHKRRKECVCECVCFCVFVCAVYMSFGDV